MIALTISEPWAWAIVDLSLASEHWKRVENRHERFPRIRGRLLIHSGQGNQYASLARWRVCSAAIERIAGCRPPAWSEIRGRGLIGVADVAAVVEVAKALDADSGWAQRLGLDPAKLAPWAEGPSCLCFAAVAPFARPIPYRGQQGLFDVPDWTVREAVEAAEERAGIRQFGGG